MCYFEKFFSIFYYDFNSLPLNVNQSFTKNAQIQTEQLIDMKFHAENNDFIEVYEKNAYKLDEMYS